MKKILSSILIFVCFAMLFSGCSNELGEKYWIEIANITQEVMLGEDFEKVYNIEYSSNLNEIIDAEYGSDYAELKNVFDPLFASAISFAYNHFNDLMIASNINNDFKKSVYNLKDELNKFTDELKVFNQQKAKYEENITFKDEAKATSDIEKSRLLKFKRDYITLIEKAIELSQSVFEARRIGCYDFADYSQDGELANANVDVSLAINATNIKIVDITINVVRAHNAKNIASSYSKFTNCANSYYKNFVVKYETNNLSLADDIKQKLNIWQGAYDLFNSDAELFNQILSKLDVNKLNDCDYNAEQYAQSTNNKQDKQNAEYYNNFYVKLYYMMEYSLILFS